MEHFVKLVEALAWSTDKTVNSAGSFLLKTVQP
jgi:hypothetical protein